MADDKENLGLTFALAYARIGWKVLPLHWPIGKNRCSCRKDDCDRIGKHPRYDKVTLEHGVNDATTDPDTIRAWWTKWPKANVGVATGAVSGIVAVDVDPRHGGDTSLKELYRRNVYDGHTTRSITGGGGFHEIWAYPPGGSAIKNKGGVGGLAGLDVRSDGGLIVVPPSVHQTGRKYRWDCPPPKVAPAPMPDWLFKVMAGGPGKTNERNGSYDWDHVFDGIADGNRDNTLFRYACYLRNLNLGRIAVETLVLKAAEACPNPFPPEKALQKVAQAFQYQPADLREVMLDADPTRRYINVKDYWTWAMENTRDDQWIVEGWLPARSTGLVVGKSGSFKSWLTLGLCVAVASGKAFLGKYPVNKPGKVILFQQEDQAMTTIRRLAVLLNVGEVREVKNKDGTVTWEIPIPDRMGGNLLVDSEHLLTFENPSAMAELEEIVTRERPTLVVMDPLNSLVSAKDFMAGAPERMRLLKRLRDRFGTTFIIIHHTSKGDNEGWESIWGSQFLVGWKEFGWRLAKVKGEDATIVERYTKDGREPEQLRVDLEICDYHVEFRVVKVEKGAPVVLEGENRSTRREENRGTVEQLHDQGLSNREIARRTGISERTVARILKGEEPE